MATAIPNGNINIPFSTFLDATTGRPSQEWLMWLMNPSFVSANFSAALAVTSGGTGLTTIPTNGQLLIGNGTGYALNTLIASTGITVTNGPGTITLTNSGVISFSAGTTGFTPSSPTTGAVVLAGTLVIANGGTGATTAAGARANLGAGTVISVGGTGTVNGITLTGTVTTAGNLTLGGTLSGVSLTTQVSGTLPIANGGTGTTSTTFVSLTTNVSGTLPIANGGTGTTSTTFVDLTANVSGILPIANGGTGTSTAGVSATIVTAKLTALGADGSMTFTNGLLTAQTPAT